MPAEVEGAGAMAPVPGTRLTVAAPVAGYRRARFGWCRCVRGRRCSARDPRVDEDGARRAVPGRRAPSAPSTWRSGALVAVGDPLAVIEASVGDGPVDDRTIAVDPGAVRPDLAELFARQRPAARRRPARRGGPAAPGRATDRPREHRRPVRPGQLHRVRRLAIAAQRGRRPLEELIERTPADGLVVGCGSGQRRPLRRRAGVELRGRLLRLHGAGRDPGGQQNHRKKDRLFELVERLRLPVVLFAEGGGGRPGDTDYAVITGLDTRPSPCSARLSGLVPLVGIASGWCFAGNAALLGCCDVIIATEGTSIGMGGPAMIEGGGLGTVPTRGGRSPRRPGGQRRGRPGGRRGRRRRRPAWPAGTCPTSRVPTSGWECADQRLLRSCVPEERLRVYDIRALLDTLADTDSVLELRAGFGAGMVTALVRIEGRPVGVVANDPTHLGGAIDRRRCRQGGPVPAAVRRPRPAGAVPVRHARASWSGRRPSGPARSATSAACSSSARASPCRSSPSCCARATASAPRPWPAGASGRPSLPCGVAERRARRDGARGCGATRVPPRARGGGGPGGAGGPLRQHGRACLRARQGAERGHRLRDRRRHRSGRLPPQDRRGPPGALRHHPTRNGKKRSCIDTW